ncbi:MAG TPA: hypothetical protein VL403_01260 [Candidatus Kryptonia bacterium]|nr:hypothetical protein [Candidatus Kryptonia bacterium]
MALLAALIAPAIPASAASHDGPCAADAQKLCPGVPAGGGRIKKCLREHQADLSDACKARIQQALAERKGPHHACAADVEKFCQGVPAGGGKIAQCLKDHAADLSPECQAAWATHRQQHALKSGAASQPAPAQ